MSEVLHGSRIIKASVTEDRLHPDVLAKIAGGLTDAQVTAKINQLKTDLFGGNVSAALDTFAEIAAAITNDQSGLAALTAVVNGKASPADITAAVNAVVGGAGTNANTLAKLEALINAASASAVIADGAITNPKLGTDVKIGSNAAARNAFTFLGAADRASLQSVENFLVALAAEIGPLKQRADSQAASLSDHQSRLTTVEQALPNKASQSDFNALGQRVTNLENAPAPTGTGSTNGVTLVSNGNGSQFLSNDGSYKTIQSGSVVTIEQNLTSNSTTAVPSIAAVRSAVNATLGGFRDMLQIVQGQTQFRYLFIEELITITQLRITTAVQSYAFTLMRNNADGTEVLGTTRVSPTPAQINADITALTSAQRLEGYTLIFDFTLVPGLSNAGAVLDGVPA